VIQHKHKSFLEKFEFFNVLSQICASVANLRQPWLRTAPSWPSATLLKQLADTYSSAACKIPTSDIHLLLTASAWHRLEYRLKQEDSVFANASSNSWPSQDLTCGYTKSDGSVDKESATCCHWHTCTGLRQVNSINTTQYDAFAASECLEISVVEPFETVHLEELTIHTTSMRDIHVAPRNDVMRGKNKLAIRRTWSRHVQNSITHYNQNSSIDFAQWYC
jgi:hypothetical protein